MNFLNFSIEMKKTEHGTIRVTYKDSMGGAFTEEIDPDDLEEATTTELRGRIRLALRMGFDK